MTRDGELIHKETETFSTKAAAKDWAQKREVELKDPKASVTADVLINHIRQRRLGGAGPSTAANDLIWIRI